jgi:cytochrome c peroxidase
MHDGRFSTIREVINHYTDGLNDKTSSSQELKEPIRLTSDEKTDLVAFLLTLNDEEFVFNKKHHYPLEILRIN